MIKAVLFDFWGTLVENGTYSPLRQTYNILRARMPFSQFAEQFERTVWTKSFPDQASAFNAACESLNIDAKPFVIDKLIGVWNKNKLLAEMYPDTVDTLKALKEKGLKLVLVSNCPDDNIEPLLERFQIKEYFDFVLLSYAEGKLKTDGLFDIALKKLKMKSSSVLSVGDSIETDIKGATKSGIKACLVDRKDRREYECKIKALSELLKVVEESE